jgi:hypothetical protein
MWLFSLVNEGFSLHGLSRVSGGFLWGECPMIFLRYPPTDWFWILFAATSVLLITDVGGRRNGMQCNRLEEVATRDVLEGTSS